MSLVTFPLAAGKSLDLESSTDSSLLQTWCEDHLALPETGTHYGFVYRGEAKLQRSQGTYRLCPGMYFALPQAGRIGGPGSSGFVITVPQHQPRFSLGGPMGMQTGDFCYINGGTDSLLLPPIQLGDPCLNALYFPAGVDQTLHTHPSYRLGLVVAGAGLCHTPAQKQPLHPGHLFLIPAEQPHRFQTTETGLTLVVFHPDSDTGFTHQNHPMLRRTLVNGVSAVDLPELHTPARPTHSKSSSFLKKS